MINYNFPVTISRLSKIYPPDKLVLDEIDLTVVNGETIGILGNNGAGKTTLLRIMATILFPSSGFVKIFGMNPFTDANEIKKKTGYLPERFSFYPYYTVEGILDFFENLLPEKSIDKENNREKIIKLLNLDSYLESRIKTLSKGMLHKVGIAITLIHNPPLLLLDEPTGSVDNQYEQALIEAMKSYLQDKTLVLVTHRATMLELADSVIVMERGRIVADGPKDAIMAAIKDRQAEKVSPDDDDDTADDVMPGTDK